MTILITGGAGFIGSNFITYYIKQYPSVKIVTLDKLTYAGNLSNLKEVVNLSNCTFVKGDICDRNLIERLFKEYNFKGVIHFAAESHVDNSIKKPNEFISTNVLGTFNLIDVARNHWMESPHNPKEEHINSRFHHISTDEVYGSLEKKEELFTEQTPYAPNSP